MRKVGIVMGSDSDLPIARKATDALAANTTVPVIGVPCSGGLMGGMDALLSTVQMPGGIPVACVGVDNGKNAALLAAEILAVEDAELAARLDAQREEAAAGVLAKDAGIAERLHG